MSGGVSEMCLGCIWGVSGVYLGVSEVYLGRIWGVSGVYLDVSGGYLGVSGVHLWWPSAVEGWVTPRICLIFVDFYQKCPKKSFFVSKSSNCLQITKNNFLRFLHFYPLISSIQPLSCHQCDEAWNSLSFAIKNSSFDFIWLEIDRFSIDCR